MQQKSINYGKKEQNIITKYKSYEIKSYNYKDTSEWKSQNDVKMLILWQKLKFIVIISKFGIMRRHNYESGHFHN